MGNVVPFPASSSPQIGFTRGELSQIINLYGRMVAAGEWKDYAVEFGRDHAAFWAFRRAAERPEFKIEKRPSLRNKQGMWALVNEAGMVLRRGHELGPVLAPIERRLLKIVNE
ncbi:MAG TPA: DUF2794 domain-containing protein [Allosphingosinicella sp.]|jgi:hypothetical protein